MKNGEALNPVYRFSITMAAGASKAGLSPIGYLPDLWPPTCLGRRHHGLISFHTIDSNASTYHRTSVRSSINIKYKNCNYKNTNVL